MPRREKRKNRLLWKCFREEQEDTPSFLFGSMHQFPSANWPRREQIFRLLSEGRLQWVATETPLEESASAHMLMQRMGLSENWQEQIPPKKRERLQKILCKSSGIDLSRLGVMPPIVLLEFLQRQWLSSLGELHSIDLEIWEKAGEYGLQTLGLESNEEHYGLLEDISLKDQIHLLLQTTRNIRRSRKRLYHLYDLYREENLAQLHQSAKRGMGKMREKMLYARNRLMAERIARLADRAPGLAVMGAAHLSGGKGVIRLLKQKGFKVKALP
ncbi:MAG TPA: TraB/GumN family protein [Phaeodactylibacter sp.]|nr:TraB/GumN family protein [Phaeodactylibacter sp.]